MKSIAAFIFALAFLTQGMAFAQGRNNATHDSTNVPPPNQEMTFGDELVSASLVRPDEATVRGNRPVRGISLLRVRQHFVQEMLKSVENL